MPDAAPLAPLAPLAPPAPLIRLEVSGLPADDPDLIAFRDFLQQELGGEARLREVPRDASTEQDYKGWPEVIEFGVQVVECYLLVNDVLVEDKLRLMALWTTLSARLQTLGAKAKHLSLRLGGKSVPRPDRESPAQLRDILRKERPRE